MRRFWSLCLLAIVAGSALMGGCAAPIVPITHSLPPAVPLPDDIVRIEAGQFAVTEGPEDQFAATVGEDLQRRLGEFGTSSPSEASTKPAVPASRPAQVGGNIRIRTKDTTGVREVRRLNSETHQMESDELSTLVRTLEVEVDFVIARRDAGEPIVVVETRRSYSSLNDPRVRGELGLRRIDDPQNVPPADLIVSELLAECVDEFCKSIAPLKVSEQVPLRWSPGAEAEAALAAASTGDSEAAMQKFAEALKTSPDDLNLIFNLAVTAEATGDLPTALNHYQTIVGRTNGRDQPAAAGARRVERVITYLKASRR